MSCLTQINPATLIYIIYNMEGPFLWFIQIVFATRRRKKTEGVPIISLTRRKNTIHILCFLRKRVLV